MIRSGYFVELDKKFFHKENNVYLERTYYYKKRGSYVLGQYDATAMTLALATELVDKLKADPQVSTEFCRIELKERTIDEETVLLQHLWELGETAPPPKPAPTGIQELHRVIEKCFEQGLTQLEILNECNKAVIG